MEELSVMQQDDDRIMREKTTSSEPSMFAGSDTGLPDGQPQQAEPELDTAQGQDWKARYEETHEKYLRAIADLQNYRRRVSRDMADRQQYANEDLLTQLLPVADNCGQALAGICQTDDPECIIKGVEMILAQLHDFMQGHGVEQISPLGQQFDPNLHEAVEAVPTDQTEPNTIVGVLQPGYTLRERLLRPAKVRVAVAPKT
jgi:molecular chaperone GrpE